MAHDGVSGGCCGGGSAAANSGSKGSNDSCDTPKFEATEERPIHLTEAAVEAVKNAIKQEGEAGDGLRVSVVGGGCSGLQYNLDFEKEPRIGDLVIDFGGVNIFLDSVSVRHLTGTVIDYVSGLQGTGFKFINPNAKRTCGCGSSFS